MQIKQECGYGVENPPPRSFWYGERGIARRGARKIRAREGLERGV